MSGTRTLLRAPRMDAVSGVWLEGFSKRDARATLIVLPWALMVGSLAFYAALYVLEEQFPQTLGFWENLEAMTHLTLAGVCALYLLVALTYERPCCRCRRGGPRRSVEGWLALLPLVVCAVCSFQYARGRHSRRDMTGKVGNSVVLIHGDLLFRAAASLEFLMQLIWLWAADQLRYEGQPTPTCKLWFYGGLPLLWCLTFCGPSDGTPPQRLDHVLVLIGYSARLCVSVYCFAHVCSVRARQCCCGCLQDWLLEDLPCTPGHRRLRYLLYYLLIRPPFLLLVNLPLGYPLAICAPFASAVRCCFALLLAVVLKPAPHEAIGQHQIEADTRKRFDIRVAMRLWDFANETYMGPPAPETLNIKGCRRQELNGDYKLDDRDGAGICMYSRELTQGLSCPADGAAVARVEAGTRVFLRRTAAGEWEISPRVSTKAGQRWAYVKDEALLPNQISSLWFEVDEGEPAVPASNTNIQVVVVTETGARRRRFEKHGSCAHTDVHWLIVEEEGPLVAPVSPGATEEVLKASNSEVSIVIAFRGTNSLQNMLTDARISMGPLTDAPVNSAALSAGYAAFEEEGDGAAAVPWWRPRLPRWVRARRSLQPLNAGSTLFDLELQVSAELRRGFSPEAPMRAEGASASSSSGGGGGEHREPLAEAVEDESLPAGSRGFCRSCICWVCRFLGRGCMLVCFPFMPASDFEEDDEAFAVSTVAHVRAHRGFSEAYASVREDLKSSLQERLGRSGRKVSVYVTGHSLGGAIASLCALDLAERELGPVVYTFGSPRLGNAAFRSICNVLVPDTFRLVASRDLVPTLPPSITYRQLGREVWFDDAGEATFVMSWAMRHILPARDNLRFHSMVSYFRILNKAFRREFGREYTPDFRNDIGLSV